MTKLIKFIFITLSLTSLMTPTCFSSQIEVFSLTAPVEDRASILSASVVADLSVKLRKLYEDEKAQIVILTLPSLNDEPIESLSIRFTDEWKLGAKKVNDGILITLAPRERKVRIEVGRGLEGVFPDIITGRIIREIMTPRFRENPPNYGLALINAIDYMEKRINGERSMTDQASQYYDELSARQRKYLILGILFGFLIFMGVLYGIVEILNRKYSFSFSRLVSSMFFSVVGVFMIGERIALHFMMNHPWLMLPIFALITSIVYANYNSMFSTRRRSGGWWGGSGGGWGNGGSGGFGGGFSGGGGSFGGGGSSGSW